MSIVAENERRTVVADDFRELSRLIDPISLDVFWRTYHERQPLVVHRADPHRFTDLLSLAGIDEALSLVGGMDQIRVVTDGKETPIGDVVKQRGTNSTANALETLYEHYRDGCTVIVNGLESRWAPLRQFARMLGHELDARIQVNIYLTPPGSRGFKTHYDMHDVFIAQVHGSKQWRLAGAPTELPLKDNPYDQRQPEPEPVQEFDLCPGDVLYLPRGTLHSGAANESASLHLTIGIHPVLWSQMFTDALHRVYADDVRFRRSLPVGFTRDESVRQGVEDTFDELREALLQQLSSASMTATAANRVTSLNAPALDGHLLDLEQMRALDLETPVRRRPDVVWRLSVADSVAGLSFHNKTVRFPEDVADEVRYVAEDGTDWFTARDIPGDLDDAGRRTLVHTLLNEGFLTFR